MSSAARTSDSLVTKCSVSHVAASADARRLPATCAADVANLRRVELGALGLGDVGRGVEVEDVGRRAVRLIAHDAAARVRPVGPRLGEAFEHEVGDGLAIVGEHAPRGVRRAALEQRGQMQSQIVAAARLELVEHPRRPVALAARVVHLVRVVEEAAHAHVAAGEGAVEPAQVVGDRLAREVVDHVPLAARRGALDLLAVPALKEGVERPLTVERVQVDDAGRRHARGDVLDVALLRVRHDGDERQRLREARLIDRERLEVRRGCDGVLQRGDVDASAHGAHEGLLHERDRVPPPLAALDGHALPRDVLRRVRVADARPAERPAGAGGHVDAESQAPRLREGVLEHRHPRRGQVRDELLLGAAHSIDGSDLDAAEPDALVRLEVPREVGRGSPRCRATTSASTGATRR